ncbi:MAG TPA: helix-turn-helix domain-containing protein, partial [Pirellulaceae bacterium]|nr:helix-turn-helix domain-containing protein [Pirellulaceae bacterium]
AGSGKPQTQGGPVLIDCRLIDAETLQRTLTATWKQTPLGARDVLLREVEHLSAESAAELIGFLQLPNHGLRILATAQHPLVGLAAKDSFGAVLSARLSGLVIEVPPLSQRREDIPILAQVLLESIARHSRTSVRSLAPPVLKQLAEYHWPGEVAELKDVVRQAVERCVQSQILVADLPDRFRLAHAASCTPRYAGQEVVLDEYLADIERRLLERALHQSKWNKAQAARCLSISRARLIRRAEQLGIQFPTPDIPFEEMDDEPS